MLAFHARVAVAPSLVAARIGGPSSPSALTTLTLDRVPGLAYNPGRVKSALADLHSFWRPYVCATMVYSTSVLKPWRGREANHASTELTGIWST